jgi:hypothetical protein
MVIHTCNPSTREPEQEDHEFNEAGLHREILSQKKKSEGNIPNTNCSF